MNFTVYGTKIGGHIYWIQADQTPLDRDGHKMVFIGQFLQSPVDLGDSALAYIFYSSKTQETKLRVQGF